MICSLEMLQTETVKKKKVLVGNNYPLELIYKVIKLHDDNCRKPKLFGQQKFLTVHKLIWVTHLVYFKGRTSTINL